MRCQTSGLVFGAHVPIYCRSMPTSVRLSVHQDWMTVITQDKVVYSPLIAHAWVRSLDLKSVKDRVGSNSTDQPQLHSCLSEPTPLKLLLSLGEVCREIGATKALPLSG